MQAKNDVNFDFLVPYLAQFAGDLPTQAEIQVGSGMMQVYDIFTWN